MQPTRMVLVVSLVTLTSATLTCGAAEQRWSELRGRFVVEDARLDLDGSRESLVVHPENHGLANVLVYLAPQKNRKVIPIHGSYADHGHDDVTLRIKDGRFTPRIALVRTSQSLVMTNHDPHAYNPNIPLVLNPALNWLLPSGENTR